MAPTCTRKNVRLADRLEIVKKLEKGVGIKELAAEYGLGKRTIQRYRKDAAQIRLSSKDPYRMQTKRQRPSLHEDINNRLYSWFLERRTTGENISDSLLQEKAKQFHAEIGSTNSFTASRGWLWRFKLRYNIRSLIGDDEKAEANQCLVDQFVRRLAELMDEEDIDEEDVYDMDETCLAWKVLPERTRKGRRCVVGKNVNKIRVAVAFCANSAGTHKLPPLFVHRSANPRALKHCRDSLPVVYKSQTNGWVTEAVFADWYLNHFKPCVRQRHSQENRAGKVLLLVDNFKGHVISQELREDQRFKLVFLPPDVTDLIQPMGQGIIAECKKLFRYKLLRWALEYNGGIQQFYANYDIKDCIDLITEAWNDIRPGIISDSWNRLLDREMSDVELEGQDSDNSDLDSKNFVNISANEIADWIAECEQAESVAEREDNEQMNIHVKDEIDCPSEYQIDEDELDSLFHKLGLLSETEPEYIKLQTKVLIDYYSEK